MKTKKLLAALLTLLIFLSPTFAAAETVVTSFYPIYLFALNLTQGIDGITIRNLAAPNTGCLHDYQLSTGDMKVLNKADVFLINGAGMESYLIRVMDTFPKLPVVDASAGITLLTEDGMDEYVDDHDHDHEDEDADDHGHHHAGEANAHIWLDAQNAIQMVDNLADGLISAMPQYEAQIEQNRADYVSRLTALDAEEALGLSGEQLPHRTKRISISISEELLPEGAKQLTKDPAFQDALTAWIRQYIEKEVKA